MSTTPEERAPGLAAGLLQGGSGGSAPVPEPGTLFLVGTGLLGVALTARFRRRDRNLT